MQELGITKAAIESTVEIDSDLSPELIDRLEQLVARGLEDPDRCLEGLTNRASSTDGGLLNSLFDELTKESVDPATRANLLDAVEGLMQRIAQRKARMLVAPADVPPTRPISNQLGVTSRHDGEWVLRIAGRLVHETKREVIEQLVSDMRIEIAAYLAQGRSMAALGARIRGYCAIAHATGLIRLLKWIARYEMSRHVG